MKLILSQGHDDVVGTFFIQTVRTSFVWLGQLTHHGLDKNTVVCSTV